MLFQRMNCGQANSKKPWKVPWAGDESKLAKGSLELGMHFKLLDEATPHKKSWLLDDK